MGGAHTLRRMFTTGGDSRPSRGSGGWQLVSGLLSMPACSQVVPASAHPFPAKDRAAGFRYEISILQAEFSLTQVLDRPLTGRFFFEQVIRDNVDAGRRGPTPNPPPADLATLLTVHAGNVSAVARALGKQSCVVRRWIAREHVDLASCRTPVVRPDIEAAYAAVDAALRHLAAAVCLPSAA